ncbi:MAG: hypothetical protein ACJATI_003903 [Halioglobus sp.]|jgi:hypothetical protein
MTTIKQYRIGGNPNGGGGGPFGMIGSLIMLTLGLILAYMVIKGVFTLLFWLSPVLLIAGVAVDPKGALNIGKSFITLSKKNPLIPIGIVILSALWFPVIPGVMGALTGGFLVAKYFVKKKIKKVFNQHTPQESSEESQEFVDYEEVNEEEDFLNLPPVEPKAEPQKKSNNEYDNMF